MFGLNAKLLDGKVRRMGRAEVFLVEAEVECRHHYYRRRKHQLLIEVRAELRKVRHGRSDCTHWRVQLPLGVGTSLGMRCYGSLERP